MKRLVWFTVALTTLVAAGAGWLAWEGYRTKEALTERIVALEDAVADVSDETDDIQGDLNLLRSERATESLSGEVSELRTQLANVRSDVRFLDAQQGRILNHLGSVGSSGGGGVEKPPFCLEGDPVYWDFGDALTC